MLSNPASDSPSQSNSLHPVLQSFAEECHGLLVRLLGYVGALALVAIASLQMFGGIIPGPRPPAAAAEWSKATHSRPAFAIHETETGEKTVSYDVFRHPDGGRRDVILWTAAGQTPAGELELLRAGNAGHAELPAADVAARMDPGGLRAVVAEGMMNTKFGAIPLLGFADRPVGARNCLRFTRLVDGVNLRLSGWSCAHTTIPALRASIACTLDRLTLLSAGNDPELAGAFARAELQRSGCGAPAVAMSADWVTGSRSPLLRGAL